jgi:hypothetical protein
MILAGSFGIAYSGSNAQGFNLFVYNSHVAKLSTSAGSKPGVKFNTGGTYD